ncbi:hypothetical protein K469DRAFT_683740 [Zopfia rhizophila CBS 207.26]|uniref:Zn(2)-C6 fungal-type domain-containing protein n=1 Tax=Zopfia rhizophila CBS 207.26 TaxID=1314779 RepID=A0A6A6EDN4_9PEZI|nr:hypothetical protein K469DRAFT_683740 [Zopfia rhizophila CBS 207.26]
MVNTDQPSRGCLTCRLRCVKCDEQRPNCKRCLKLRPDCEWKDEWNSVVRHQESWAKKKVVQRVERVQNLRNLQAAPTHADFQMRSRYRSSARLVRRFTPLPAFTATTPEQQPHARFFITPSCLHSVVPAVALASMAKQQRRHDLMKKADKHYGRTLRKLAQCLSDPATAKHDATLLTVFMLILYEVPRARPLSSTAGTRRLITSQSISYDRYPAMPCPYQSHSPGRLAPLRLRGREQLQTQAGRNLFIILYHEQLVASFIGKSEPLEECPSWIYEASPPSPIMSMRLLSFRRQKSPGSKTESEVEVHDNLTLQFYASTDALRTDGTKASKTSMSALKKDMKTNENMSKDRKQNVGWRPQNLKDIPPDFVPKDGEFDDPDVVAAYLSVTRVLSSTFAAPCIFTFSRSFFMPSPYCRPCLPTRLPPLRRIHPKISTSPPYTLNSAT